MAHKLGDAFEKKFTDGKNEVTLKFIPIATENGMGRVEFHSPKKRLGYISYIHQFDLKGKKQKPMLYIEAITSKIPQYVRAEQGLLETLNKLSVMFGLKPEKVEKKSKYTKVPTLAVQELEKLAKKAGVRSIAVVGGSPYWTKQKYSFVGYFGERLKKIQAAFKKVGKKPSFFQETYVASRTHIKPLLRGNYPLTTQKKWKAVRKGRRK